MIDGEAGTAKLEENSIGGELEGSIEDVRREA